MEEHEIRERIKGLEVMQEMHSKRQDDQHKENMESLTSISKDIHQIRADIKHLNKEFVPRSEFNQVMNSIDNKINDAKSDARRDHEVLRKHSDERDIDAQRQVNAILEWIKQWGPILAILAYIILGSTGVI